MATTKNITMKQFNGTDYDTLYPKTIASQIPDVYNQTEVLTETTAELYELARTAIPNDVFVKIRDLLTANTTLANTKCQVVNGSYVGTGSGSVQLTFDATPQLIVVGGLKNSNNTEGFLVAPRGTGTVAVAGNGDANYYAYVSWGDNSVSLSGSKYYNPNVSGRTHYYTAIIYG